MAAAKKPPILIKRVKKSHPHPHHGGAWKLAYADFVTAMMAFFLLMWLLNATTEVQRQGIANYFQPTLVSEGASGSNGLLGGRSMAADGAQTESMGPPTINPEAAGAGPGSTIVGRAKDDDQDTTPGAADGSETEPPEAAAAKKAEAQADPQDGQDAQDGQDDGETKPKPKVSDEAAMEHVEKLQDQQFKKAEAELRAAIADNPALQQLSQSLLIDRTADGMRIQIVDQANISMFPVGSSSMFEPTHELMKQVAAIVATLPNRIAISGHTDARQYASGNGYSNWELSSDRANASRRALIDAGVPEGRIASVTGRADQDLFVPDDPFSPRNRRISITLLYDPTPGGPH